jgi:hypothetical protein
VVLIVITHDPLWAMFYSVPEDALTGRFRVAQSDYEEASNEMLGECKIIDTESPYPTSGIIHKVFGGGGDLVSMEIGIWAVRQLNSGVPMPLDLKDAP